MLRRDKALHFTAGAAIALLCLTITGSAVVAVAAAVIAGCSKEVYDMMHPEYHTADTVDMLATAAGGIFMAALVSILGGIL